MEEFGGIDVEVDVSVDFVVLFCLFVDVDFDWVWGVEVVEEESGGEVCDVVIDDGYVEWLFWSFEVYCVVCVFDDELSGVRFIVFREDGLVGFLW